MSIVIVGGNECMVRRYKDLCEEYQCEAKVFPKISGRLKNKIGNPDMLVFFTNTLSHKMLKAAMNEVKGQNTVIERARSSSIAALRKILEEYASGGEI